MYKRQGCVYALAMDPVTSTLYVGGDFTAPGNHVAKWSGFSWGPVGAGFNNSVRSLLWQGNTLYAGGAFTANGWNTVTLNYVAPVSYTHLRAHETVLDLVCRLLLAKKKKQQ